MGFWDGIAALGLAGRGYENTDRAIRDRDWQKAERERQKKLNDIALKDALRRDELATGLRDAMTSVPTRETAKGVDIVTHEGEPYDEERRVAEGIDAPADSNLPGKAKAAMDYLADKGDIEGAERYRKTLKALEAEGYRDMVTSMAAGRPIKEWAPKFNQVGEERIVGGDFDGQRYRVKYESGREAVYDRNQMRDAAEMHGFFKREKPNVVPQGSELRDDRGALLARNPKPQTPRNIDPLSDEGLQATEKQERMKQRIKAEMGGGSKATAMVQNLEYLSSKMGISIKEAYEMSRTGMSKPEHEQVLDTATKLLNGFETSTKYQNRETGAVDYARVFEDARRMMEMAKQKRKAARAAEQPLGVPNSDPSRLPPLNLKAPGGGEATFTGKYTKAGKPIYSDGTNSYVGE